jgi:hypothetical protein
MENTDKIAPPVSHKTILKYSGIIGFVLPIVLVFGNIAAFDRCQSILSSISTYYHSGLGDYFVASLAALAFCFYAYHGYNSTDKLLTNIAAIALLGVAFLPTYIEPPFDKCLISNSRNEMLGNLHYVCAVIFFLIISFFCLFQFTKGKEPFNNKKKRINVVFKICGILMIVCITFIAIYSFYLKDLYPNIANYSPVFWGEAISLWLFSIAWFIKGEITFD